MSLPSIRQISAQLIRQFSFDNGRADDAIDRLIESALNQSWTAAHELEIQKTADVSLLLSLTLGD